MKTKKLSLVSVVDSIVTEGPVSGMADMARGLTQWAANNNVPGASIGNMAISDNDYLAVLQTGATAMGAMALAAPIGIYNVVKKAMSGDPQATQQVKQLAAAGMKAKSQQQARPQLGQQQTQAQIPPVTQNVPRR